MSVLSPWPQRPRNLAISNLVDISVPGEGYSRKIIDICICLYSYIQQFKYLYVRNIIKVRCVLLCAAIGPSEEHVIDGIYC
jgi:hypothetical protein